MLDKALFLDNIFNWYSYSCMSYEVKGEGLSLVSAVICAPTNAKG